MLLLFCFALFCSVLFCSALLCWGDHYTYTPLPRTIPLILITHRSQHNAQNTHAATPTRHQEEALRVIGTRQIRGPAQHRTVGASGTVFGQRHDLGLRIRFAGQIL